MSDLEAHRAVEKVRAAAGGERAGGGRKRRAGEALSVRDSWKYVGRRVCRNCLPWPCSLRRVWACARARGGDPWRGYLPVKQARSTMGVAAVNAIARTGYRDCFFQDTRHSRWHGPSTI